MLSRIAESLFWIGRYVERADDTARILDAVLSRLLEDPWADEDQSCRLLLDSLGVPVPEDTERVTSAQALGVLAFDETSPTAIAGAWTAARDNARGAREAVSTEMWECLNTTWQALPSRRRAAERIGSYTYVAYVRERSALLSGLAQSTMSHDEGYQFVVLGRSLERLDMTTRLLSVQALDPVHGPSWTTLLRAAGAEGAYLRSFGANVTAQTAAEFLLLDKLFPRSAVAALTDAEDALLDIAGLSATDGVRHYARGPVTDPARRYIGQARTRLEYADTKNLLAELPGLLRSLQDAGGRSSLAVTRKFFQHGNTVQWVHEGV